MIENYNNKVINANCFEVMQNMIEEGVKVDAIITDPPYNMTACEWDKQIDLNRFWKLANKICKDDSNILIFSKQPFTTLVNYSNLRDFRYEIIWQKQQATNPMCAKKRIMPIHENISVFYKKLGTYNPQMRYGYDNYTSYANNGKKIGEIYGLKSKHRECKDGSRYPISVVNYNNVRKGLHPTQKPIELITYLLHTFTNEGDLVLDCFSGSGVVGKACQETRRRFICVEKDKSYYEKSLDYLGA